MSSHLANGRPRPRHGIVTAAGSKNVAGFHAVVLDGHDVGLRAMCHAWSHRRWHTPRDQSSTRCWRNAAANRALIRRMVSSHGSSSTRTQPAMLRNMRRCTASSRGRWAVVKGSTSKPYNTGRHRRIKQFETKSYWHVPVEEGLAVLMEFAKLAQCGG